ncbi:MAG: response regulator [Pseudomonadales bacterium]|nr:response regulator [Pseudomonadales bacterium]
MEIEDLSTAQAKPRVLVIDDSKLLRKAANKILERYFDVKTAEDGEDGWEQIAVDDTIQVVFCDLMMPVLDGYGFLERVRSSKNNRIFEIPIIIVTGGESEEAKEKAFALGATDFITKPFNSIDVLARAKAHSTNQKKTQELVQNNTLLAQNTTIDPTTGLGNKLYFLEKVKQDISFSRRHRLPLSLIIFEVAEYNNIFLKNGKKVSEKIIYEVAKLVSKTLRSEDGVARVSASQIVVTLLSTSGGNAQALCERISASVGKLNFLISGCRLEITLRYGSYSPTSEGALTAEETLLRLAENLGMEKLERLEKDSDEAIPKFVPRVDIKDRDDETGFLDVSRILQKLDDAKYADVDSEFTKIERDLWALIFTTTDEKKRKILDLLSELK